MSKDKHISRKRQKKLLMAAGYQRNDAEKMAYFHSYISTIVPPDCQYRPLRKVAVDDGRA